ncbi:hypothetical protein CSB87_3638 [Acinetobacter sp. AR_0276]|nr:hypothetical protein CSB87_3638 [Acinetobacter sp. AR_0276]
MRSITIKKPHTLSYVAFLHQPSIYDSIGANGGTTSAF